VGVVPRRDMHILTPYTHLIRAIYISIYSNNLLTSIEGYIHLFSHPTHQRRAVVRVIEEFVGVVPRHDMHIPTLYTQQFKVV